MALDPNYSAEELIKEQEMENNPDLHKGSFEYSHYTMVNDVHLYKSLATVGDFYCKVWFRQEEFDDDREVGERNVILIGTDSDDFSKALTSVRATTTIDVAVRQASAFAACLDVTT